MQGDFRVRLSSLEPAVVNADYVKRLLKYEKLCHHLHLSAQSGSDDILCAMNRPYDRKGYMDIVKILKEFDQLGAAPMKKSTLKIGDIELDDESKEVVFMGNAVRLTPKEYGILRLLMENRGKVFAPKEIYRAVWEEDSFGAEGTVAVHIRHIREKLEINPDQPRHIKVVWGQGYKIE